MNFYSRKSFKMSMASCMTGMSEMEPMMMATLLIGFFVSSLMFQVYYVYAVTATVNCD